MTIIELRNKRAQKLAAAKAYLEAKRTPDGFLSEEERTSVTKSLAWSVWRLWITSCPSR